MSNALRRLTLDVELADGQVLQAQVANPSMVAWDRTRATRNLPGMKDAPILWQTFLAWHHLKATGQYADTFDKFADHDCLYVGMLDDDEDTDVVDPTQADLVAD